MSEQKPWTVEGPGEMRFSDGLFEFTVKFTQDSDDDLAATHAVVEHLNRRADEGEWAVEVVANAGVEFEDKRIRYVSVQIDREDWERAKAILGGDS